MKKVFLFFALLLSVSLFAQERTVTITADPGNTYLKYTGTSSDVLIPTTRDTIDFWFYFRVDQYVEKIAVKLRYDMRTTADTTVSTSVFGKEFYDDGTPVSIIAATVSSAVTANNVVQVLAQDPYIVEAAYMTDVGANDSTNTAHNHTPFDFCYRYYRVRCILVGNDATGTGVNVDEIEFKLYTR